MLERIKCIIRDISGLLRNLILFDAGCVLCNVCCV
jgi:hypothetical protein